MDGKYEKVVAILVAFDCFNDVIHNTLGPKYAR